MIKAIKLTPVGSPIMIKNKAPKKILSEIVINKYPNIYFSIISKINKHLLK